jgi:outer membrane protein assembly factor BamB
MGASRRRLVAVLAATACASAMALAGSGGAVARAKAVVVLGADTKAVAYQEDPAHDGHSLDPTFTAPLTQQWTANLGGTVWYPLIVGDQVFVDVAVRDSVTFDGTEVEALSLTDGKRLWGPVSIGGLHSFGGLAYDAGRVFALNQNGGLFAFNAGTGAVDWSKQLVGQTDFSSPPTATGGKVYLSGAGTGGILYAVNESDGSVAWTADVNGGASNSPAVDSSGVYVSYDCNQAYRFSTSGTLRWDHAPYCEGGGGLTDVLHDGVDYIRDGSGTNPSALSESNGSVTGLYLSTTAPAFDGSTMVTQSSGVVTAANLNTHKALWHSKGSHHTVAPLIVNGYVVTGSSSGMLTLLDEQTGQQEWHGDAGAKVWAPSEEGSGGVTGLAEAEGMLAVPTGNSLTVFASAGTPRARLLSGPAEGSYVRSAATFTFTGAVDGATYACRLDGVSVACSSPFSVKNLSDGHHSFSVSIAGGSGPASTRTFVVDRRAPTSRVMAWRHRFTTASTMVVRWGGADLGSGVSKYDLRERAFTPSGRVMRWHRLTPSGGVDATSRTLSLPQGESVCVAVRATDKVGNGSPWSHQRCRTSLVDDRRLHASEGWTTTRASNAFDHTYTRSDQYGATLTMPGVVARRVAVAAVVCPTCGSLSVSLGSMHQRISLRQRSITGSRLFVFALPAGRRAVGTLELRVASNGKPVEIDAVGVRFTNAAVLRR